MTRAPHRRAGEPARARYPNTLTTVGSDLFAYGHVERLFRNAGARQPKVSIVRENVSWRPWARRRRPASLPWDWRLIASVVCV